MNVDDDDILKEIQELAKQVGASQTQEALDNSGIKALDIAPLAAFNSSMSLDDKISFIRKAYEDNQITPDILGQVLQELKQLAQSGSLSPCPESDVTEIINKFK